MKCKIKNISINYEIIGEGKPVVMIHGYYSDYRVMAGCMEPIFSASEGYKRIYINLPGMGKSDCAEWINSSDSMLDIVIEFIEKIIPNENFIIAGNSYGAFISRGVIYKMVDRIEGVLLICPLIVPDYKKRNLPEHVVLVKDEILLSKLNPEEAEDFKSSFVVQSERVYDRYKNEVLSGVEVADSEFLQCIMKNCYGFCFNVDELNRKVDKPTLILLGRQDNCVGYKDALNILENFPRATVSILDMAGHNLQIEQEELFNLLVKEWLSRVNVDIFV
ncbi:2-hydroxy-6-oxo-6-phenylhexa-2,4-dienoate hydrolase [Clostridium zeae]|uniref:2-hydroxy-6-oxo-6-phenylhexa-2,4-dienoate hydrolase n=1 Tax=Clostridium zeae TaxID=2759022 RepID=A0ABQ1EE04_9CLOT|nr:alpha/beta hydrolase [Clostridium zeae]GFZ33055.1 2-hydroxy-6-oxo-6-phenylhexa-2,4-dienoate hydrolase [Clostridium zeae]